MKTLKIFIVAVIASIFAGCGEDQLSYINMHANKCVKCQEWPEAHIEDERVGNGWYRSYVVIECKKCGMKIKGERDSLGHINIKYLVDAWNRRNDDFLLEK